jgi:nitronate monooxygenase
MLALPTIKVLGSNRPVIFIQGGMGVGISLKDLASAVARRGAIGTVSSIALDRLVKIRTGLKLSHRKAAAREISDAVEQSQGKGAIAINVMVLVQSLYRDSVLGAIDGGAKAIIAGAGLAMDLPDIVSGNEIALIPIVSSGRALELICRRWARQGRQPDAVILEGPLAGGHLGFKDDDIPKPEFRLENIFGPVKECALKNGDFPVMVAGGIFTRQDIVYWMNVMGADGVQMGTRFAATIESGASPEFKQAILDSREEDIEVAINPGSPSGLPFRVINTSPGYIQALERTRAFLCDKHYLLHQGPDGKLTCRAKESCDSFCICNVLLTAAGANDTEELPIYTVGANAHRVDKILSVNELMDELTGITGEDNV